MDVAIWFFYLLAAMGGFFVAGVLVLFFASEMGALSRPGPATEHLRRARMHQYLNAEERRHGR